MSIRHVIFALLIAFTSSLARAGSAPRVLSPDRRFVVSVDGGALRITASGGESLFVSSGHQLSSIQTDVEFYSDTVLWSSDSHFVAVAAGTPFLRETFVFARHEGSFVQVPLPPLAEGYDNFHITPTRWTENDTLRLTITGPHAGKAGGSSYVGTAVVRFVGEPPRCEKLSERIATRDARKTPNQTSQVVRQGL